MTTFWPVPYVGQVGQGANLHGNDCGPACVAGVIKWAGLPCPTVDELFDEVQPSGDAYTSFGDLMRLLTNHGFDPDFDSVVTTKDLYWYLVSGAPVIALIHYGSLSSIRPNKFTGNHFVIVEGITLTDVIINDPLNSVSSGENIVVPIKMFEDAWSTAIQSNRSIIIPNKPNVPPVLPDVIKAVTPRDWNGCKVRRIPGLLTDANWLRSIPQKTNGSPTLLNIYQINDSNWGKISPIKDEWISLDFTVDVK